MFRTIRYTAPLQDVSDYIVLDTETTGVDPDTDKIVEVGLVEVRGNQIVDRFSALVNPGCHIPAEASAINHIYDSDVADAPTYAQIAPTLARWLTGKVVVAHNAPFDLKFVKSLLDEFEYSGTVRYIDTLFYSRRTVSGVKNYKLQTLANHFGIDPGAAHRAVDDAITCHYLFQKCKSMSQDVYFSQKPVAIDNPEWVSSESIMPTQAVSSDSPLYNKIVVFTGELSIPRRNAMQMAVDAGAIIKDRLTLDTDYLVVGKQNPQLVGQGGKSQKQIRAAEINKTEKGHVEVIREAEFKRLCVNKQTFAASQKTEAQNPKTNDGDNKAGETVKKQSLGAMIAKLLFGLIFIIHGLVKVSEEGFAYMLTALVIGIALIIWGLVPYFKARKKKGSSSQAQYSQTPNK